MKSTLSIAMTGSVLMAGMMVIPSGCGGKTESGESVPCTTDAECSGGKCVQGTCKKILKAGGIMVGVSTSLQGRTFAHMEGIKAAAQQLGYVDVRFVEGMFGEPVINEVDKMIQEGRELIIFDSFDHRTQAAVLSKKYPGTNFLTYGGRPSGANLGAVDARIEQAWYIAGQVAAGKSKSKRLGFVGGYITPESVRAINAFARGAQEVDPATKVEPRWVGFYYDYNASKTFKYKPRFMGPQAQEMQYYAEQYATALLLDGGADVIASDVDNRRCSVTVEMAGQIFKPDGVTPQQVYTFTNDIQVGWMSQGTPMKTVMASVYRNWAPIYARVFEDTSAGKWQPFDTNEPMTQREDTVVGLSPNPSSSADLEPAMIHVLQHEQAVLGYQSVFKGPYETTGQRPPVADGATLSDKELRQMCWFVKGVVEKANPLDPASADVEARVPTTVHPAPAAENPQAGTYVLLAVAPGLPRGIGWNCDENQIFE